jgi:tetratricopeptide (TPR) repeat protein
MRLLSAALLAVALGGCSPQATLLLSALPEGTVSVLLGNLQGVDDANRRRVAEFEARGDWQGLARFADDNLARDRSNADWWIVAGYARSQLGAHAQAAERYAEAVRLEPDRALSWNLLAQSQRAAGQPDRALRTLDNALRATRDSAATHYLMGETYAELGRRREAVDAYRRALELDPQLARAWYGLGRAYAAQGRAAEARQIVPVLERLDPPLAAALAGFLAAP